MSYALMLMFNTHSMVVGMVALQVRAWTCHWCGYMRIGYFDPIIITKQQLIIYGWWVKGGETLAGPGIDENRIEMGNEKFLEH